MTTDDKLRSEFVSYCKEISPKHCCKNKCLNDLSVFDINVPVAEYLFQHAEKHQKERKQKIVDWVRIANVHRKNANAPLEFTLPFDATNCSDAQTRTLHSVSTICKKALMQLFSIKKDQWSRISKTAKTSSVVADHGLKGKEANKSKKLNALLPGLRAYLSEIEDLGEPIATRIVREVCGLTTLRDSKDDTIYLTMVMSKRSIYKNYCRERGWKLITESNGKYKKEWVGLGPPLSNVVSYAAFCRLWKKSSNTCE